VAFRIVRRCKCTNVQQVLEAGGLKWKCVDCGEKFEKRE
jgi:hypothetical protein